MNESRRPLTPADCWSAINDLIKEGHLSGNGLDKTAERNGLIIAANTIMQLMEQRGVMAQLLRDRADRVGGKVVGRVGVEPTTKRLRAAFPNEQTSHNCSESPLSEALDYPQNQPAISMPLRGIWYGLLILAALSIVGWTTYSLITSTPEHKVYERGAFRCDHSWRLPCDQ